MKWLFLTVMQCEIFVQLIVFTTIFGMSSILAAPQYPVPGVLPLYKTENFQTPGFTKAEVRDDFGQYSLSFAVSNGLRQTERSFLKLGPHGDYIPVREGTYAYVSPEGIPFSYGYIADENGFVVRASPLPVAPQPVV